MKKRVSQKHPSIHDMRKSISQIRLKNMLLRIVYAVAFYYITNEKKNTLSRNKHFVNEI